MLGFRPLTHHLTWSTIQHYNILRCRYFVGILCMPGRAKPITRCWWLYLSQHVMPWYFPVCFYSKCDGLCNDLIFKFLIHQPIDSHQTPIPLIATSLSNGVSVYLSTVDCVLIAIPDQFISMTIVSLCFDFLWPYFYLNSSWKFCPNNVDLLAF